MAAFTYCRMEFKRALRIFPTFIGGAVVLAFLLGAIALLAGKVLYGETAMERIQAGVVLPEDDKVAKQAMDMLASMDSVESICDFIYVDEEEGRKKLEEGGLSVLLIVPENFIQGIMDGSNRPVTVILPEDPGIEARAFREMAQAGSRTLGAAQAAIYAADEWLLQNGRGEEVSQAEADLNSSYLKYSLDREIYFREKTVSATGSLTAAEHFIICFFVMFLILGGIPLSGYFCRGGKIFYKKLRMIGIGDGICAASEIIALSVLYTVFIGIAAVLFCILVPPAREAAGRISFFGYTGLFLAFVAAASMITGVYELCGSRMSGMMALFFGGMMMMFLSGGILPSAFLPEGLRAAGAFMPGTYMIQGLERAVFSHWTLADTVRMAGIILIFWLAAVLGRRIHG